MAPMRQYGPAIQYLRRKIKGLAQQGVGSAERIRALTWEPGAGPALTRVRAARMTHGRPTVGKRVLKAWRRGNMGLQRSLVWRDKRVVGHATRHALLALGLLRGRPYLTLERQCQTPPQHRLVLDFIHEAVGPDLRVDWTYDRVVDLIGWPGPPGFHLTENQRQMNLLIFDLYS